MSLFSKVSLILASLIVVYFELSKKKQKNMSDLKYRELNPRSFGRLIQNDTRTVEIQLKVSKLFWNHNYVDQILIKTCISQEIIKFIIS